MRNPIGSSMTLRVFLIGPLLLAAVEPVVATPPEGYRQSWADEFDGDSLDLQKWAYRVDNKHRSIQRKRNVALRNGALVLSLRVLDQPEAGKRASGAGVVSKRRFRYGYYEVRARLGRSEQTERGWHHSFWAMAADIDDEGNVATTYPSIRRTEIDCYENATEHRGEPRQKGLSNFSQHVIVWDKSGREAGRLPRPPADVTRLEEFDASEWHTYGFQWTPQEVRFFVDGVNTKVANYPADRYEHDEVNLWLTAISANWNSTRPIASRAEYDYVRVYQKSD